MTPHFGSLGANEVGLGGQIGFTKSRDPAQP